MAHELQLFREPQMNIHEQIERYNNYHIPNGHRAKDRGRSNTHDLWKNVIIGFLSFACTILIILISISISREPCTFPKVDNVKFPHMTLDSPMFTNYTILDNSPPNPPLTDTEVDNNIKDISTSTEVAVTVTELVPKNKVAESMYRLPRTVTPLSYRIKLLLFLNIQNYTTAGEVTIRVQCVNKTDKIVMNMKKLKVGKYSVKVTTKDGNNVPILITEVLDRREMFSIQLENPLTPGEEYDVFIDFSGRIHSSSKGLYVSTYVKNGSTSTSVNTMFSPAEARSVFPCFDEPIFKARFQFIIGRPYDFTTLSNMKLFLTEPISSPQNYFLDHFDMTPVMSTYLTAFMVSQYSPLNTVHFHTNVTFTSYSMPNDIEHMTYILKLAVDISQNMEDTFKIMYPLPKLDIVAVPEQFFQAMENWGLLIFRKNVAYVDDSTTDLKKQETALILAHEIAHQWFGNLVTPKWWDNLWLKEGFSTYFAYQTIDHLFPQWTVQEKFQFEVQQKAFDIDSLQSSTAIMSNVIKPNYGIFNELSYNKGAALIRMISHFMGTSILNEAIIEFLKIYAYGNADQDDLWRTLSPKVPEPIQTIQNPSELIELKVVMDSWTHQAGFPVVTIFRDYELGSALITQERFLLNNRKDNESTWYIPLSYTSQNDTNFHDTFPKVWLKEKQELITKLPKGKGWIVANLNQSGFFHVNYDLPNWLLLIDAVATFPSNIKAQLLSDSLYLAQGNKLGYEIAFSLVFHLSQCVDYLPWKAVSNHLYYIENLVKNMPAYGNLRAFILTITERVYASLANGLDLWSEYNNNEAEHFHIENIVHISCHFDNPNCVGRAAQLLDQWRLTGINNIPEAIRQVTYCAAVKRGGIKEWEYVFHELMDTESVIERGRLLYGLGCTRETWLLTRFLNFIQHKNDFGLSIDDILILFESVASNDLGNQIAVSFLRHHWRNLLERLGNPLIVIKMVSNVVGYINTPYQVDELRNLVTAIEKKIGEKNPLLSQVIERAENNLMWMRTNYRQVEEWLEMLTNNYLKPRL